MLKIIFADDEPVILRGIRKLVDWEKLGMVIAGEYADGRSAMEGILELKPEIALLDICMPELDGITILKNIRELDLPTKVIFVSGFQDFEYAKSAITYGAVDYLLKPLILDELLLALEKAVGQATGHFARHYAAEKNLTDLIQKTVDGEGTTYTPVLAEILFHGTESEQMMRLMDFSMISYLKEYLAEKKCGMMLENREDIAIVFRGMGREAVKEEIFTLQENIGAIVDRRIGFIIGRVTDDMGKIPEEYGYCLERKRYFFFEEQMQVPILNVGEKVFLRQAGTAELSETRGRMLDAIFAQDDKAYQAAFEQFTRVLCLASDGRKEDACYYFCSTIRHLDEKMKAMSLPGEISDAKELLEKGRACHDYRQLKEYYRNCLENYRKQLRDVMKSNDKKDILFAKAYIEEHYRENLSLEVMAGIVHMNPYYFSSFFKKNAGENFKDYVNKVRVSHGVSLLLSTDLKIYEIAIETGFGDARSFAEAFSRVYGETPASYKKRVLDRSGQAD